MTHLKVCFFDGYCPPLWIHVVEICCIAESAVNKAFKYLPVGRVRMDFGHTSLFYIFVKQLCPYNLDAYDLLADFQDSFVNYESQSST